MPSLSSAAKTVSGFAGMELAGMIAVVTDAS
jgi:hypothetical protein